MTTLNFRRPARGYHVADDDEGNTYGLIMQEFGGFVVMRNERVIGSAPDLETATAVANGCLRATMNLCPACGESKCEGALTLYCPAKYACSACGKVHGVARGCKPAPVNWAAGLTPPG